MIEIHQPTIFEADVIAAVSSKMNGNMKHGLLDGFEAVAANRQRFLGSLGIATADTTLVPMTYNRQDFTRYRTAQVAEKGRGMNGAADIESADALVVTEPGHALFLPLADCAGAILYDPIHHVLMVSHLGRHNIEQQGATKSVDYLKDAFNSQPGLLKVWLSPAVGEATYPLHAFENRGLQEVVTAQLLESGVLPANLESAPIDTATSEDYFSHSQYLKGNSAPGRFAIVAMMHVQGEPAA